MTHPTQNGGDVAAKLFGQLAGLAPSLHQFDDLFFKRPYNRPGRDRYDGLRVGISDSFSMNNKVSAKMGQLQ